jgi:hypothetical protein
MKRVALFALFGMLAVSPAFGEGETGLFYLSPPETSFDSFLVKPELQIRTTAQPNESLEYLNWMKDEAPADRGVVQTLRTLGDNTKKILETPLKIVGKVLPGERRETKSEQVEESELNDAGRLKELLLNSKAEKYTFFDKEDAKKLASQKTVEEFSSEPNPKNKRFGDKLIKILVLTRDFGSEE